MRVRRETGSALTTPQGFDTGLLGKVRPTLPGPSAAADEGPFGFAQGKLGGTLIWVRDRGHPPFSLAAIGPGADSQCW